METRKMNISVTEDAYQVLERYTGPRGRGQFISQLIMDYEWHRMTGEMAKLSLRDKIVSNYDQVSGVPGQVPGVPGRNYEERASGSRRKRRRK